MSSISRDDLLRAMTIGKFDNAIRSLWTIRLAEFRGKDVKEDLDKVKKEIDDLFEQLKEKESSNSIGEG